MSISWPVNIDGKGGRDYLGDITERSTAMVKLCGTCRPSTGERSLKAFVIVVFDRQLRFEWTNGRKNQSAK